MQKENSSDSSVGQIVLKALKPELFNNGPESESTKRYRMSVDARTAYAFHTSDPGVYKDRIFPETTLKEPITKEEKAYAERKTKKLIVLLKDEELEEDVEKSYIKGIADSHMLAGKISQRQYIDIIRVFRENHSTYSPLTFAGEFYENFKDLYGEKKVVSNETLRLPVKYGGDPNYPSVRAFAKRLDLNGGTTPPNRSTSE